MSRAQQVLRNKGKIKKSVNEEMPLGIPMASVEKGSTANTSKESLYDEDGQPYNIPGLSKSEPNYEKWYRYFMKLKKSAPEVFQKIMSGD